jgi:hypothetical protein
MNWNKRPVSITILAWVYIAVGIVGFAYYFHDLLAFQHDGVWAELTEFMAIVGGAFMLRGHNWARWLAFAWIAFHVILSAFHTFHEFAIHALLCAAIAWILFRPEAAQYFRGARIETNPVQ